MNTDGTNFFVQINIFKIFKSVSESEVEHIQIGIHYTPISL